MITDSIHWAQENNQHIAVAVVDSVGELIAFSRMAQHRQTIVIKPQNLYSCCTVR